MKHYTFW